VSRICWCRSGAYNRFDLIIELGVKCGSRLI
jgi:hypothetical protein